MTREPSPHPISHMKPVRFAQTTFVYATRPKSEARNRIRIRISLGNVNYICLFQVEGDSVFVLHFFAGDSPKGSF